MYIHKLRRQAPRYKLSQEQSLDWLRASLQQKFPTDAEGLIKDFNRVTCKPEAIASRYSDLIDYSTEDKNKWQLHQNEATSAPLDRRLEIYKEACDLALACLYRATEPQPPSALIHVSCTGYLSPSPAQKLAANMGWPRNTAVYHAYHMGCYAAFPALTHAAALLSLPAALAPGSRDRTYVAVAHNELCSLHLDLSERSLEQFVIQSLFADGHIAYDVSAKKPQGESSLKLLALLEESVPNTQEAMSWRLSATAFKMGLSKAVPVYIKRAIREYMIRLSEKAELKLDRLLKEAHFAIHPGGPKVIDSIARTLELSEEQVSASRSVLQEHGNMSSATLPHIWQKLVDSEKTGDYVIAMAFGPGLTISGGVFQIQ